MRRLLIYIVWLCVGCFTHLSAEPGKQVVSPPAKRVLIIDSYRQEVYWSSALAKRVEAGILEIYPEAKIMHGCINSDVCTTKSGASLALRSIFWTLTEDTGEAPPATTLAVSSMFANNVAPDVLVFIGDEGFLHYLDFAFQLQHWTPIPVILCSVNEVVSAQGWNPLKPDDFSKMVPVEHYRQMEETFGDISQLSKEPYVRIQPVEVGGKRHYQLKTQLNYTGVKVRIPVRENLQLIHNMLPNLKELVWVDDNYYLSQYTYSKVEQELKQLMPSVVLSKMTHNRTNIDSIYNAMTQVVDGRAFLTWGLNVDASYSERSDAEVDSLFSFSKSLPPLFTLSERGFRCNYWIGGYYNSRSEIVDKTVYLIDRVLKGDSASLIPFETVEAQGIILNRTALQRVSLLNVADTLEQVTFVNYPPTFYQKYEWQVLTSFLIMIVMLGVLVYLLFQRSYDKRIRINYERYKRLYDNLQTIYSNSAVDFAFYTDEGKRLLTIVDGEEDPFVRIRQEVFSEDMFQTPYLTVGQKALLRKKGSLSCEVRLDERGQLARHGHEGHRVFHVIVKEKRGTFLARDYGYICAVVNLSQLSHDRMEKERIEALFRFAADSAKVGLAFYSLETGVGLATDAWHRILNEPEVVAGLPTYRNVQIEDRILLLEYKQKLLSGETVPDFSRDIRVLDADKVRWVKQDCYYLPERNMLVELSMDIDEQKRSEERLREAKLQAEQVNAETSKFLADISHEIRTPLNSIVGFSAVLAIQDEESESYKPIILRNCKLLVSLINNILDLSDLDSGHVKMRKEWTDISLLQDEMENYIRASLYGKPLRVVVLISEEEKSIFVDPVYFHKLSMNMLTNAVKFTETGSISFGHHTVDDHWLFEITDTGCGIREEDLPRMFKRFEKLNTYMQGTGLGLALCKSIVEHMGGEIGVRSEWGKGTTFWFTLPKP